MTLTRMDLKNDFISEKQIERSREVYKKDVLEWSKSSPREEQIGYGSDSTLSDSNEDTRVRPIVEKSRTDSSAILPIPFSIENILARNEKSVDCDENLSRDETNRCSNLLVRPTAIAPSPSQNRPSDGTILSYNPHCKF